MNEQEPEIKICPECFMVSMPSSLFICPYCGFIESTAGQLGYWQPRLLNQLLMLRLSLGQAIDYTVPSIKFIQHLRDCFGWRKPRPSLDSFVNAYLEAFMRSLEVDGILRNLPSFAFFDPSKYTGEEVEIDIVRGG